MYTLELEHGFAAAHQLQHAFSTECNDFKHGHNWKVKVTISTHALHNGMVIDFKRLKAVINELDHKDLNTILDFETSAENLSKYLYDKICEAMREKHGEDAAFSVEVQLWEADKASITYSA